MILVSNNMFSDITNSTKQLLKSKVVAITLKFTPNPWIRSCYMFVTETAAILNVHGQLR